MLMKEKIGMEKNNEITMNGTDNNSCSGNSSTVATSSNQSQPKNSYNDIFPALPGSSLPSATSQQHHRQKRTNMDNAIQKMRIGPSLISRTFRVSYEERKLDNSDKFGEGELQSVCVHIQKETGAQIEFSLSKDHSLSFIVTGKDNEVRDALQKIANRFQTYPSRQIPIPKDYHRTVIGLKGMKLKDIETMTSTKITVPRMIDPSELVTITGPKEGIEKAIQEIHRIVNEQANRATDVIMIPKPFHLFICGANNKHINAIMQETGSKINVPPMHLDKDDIVIVGNRDGVAVAKNRILEFFKDLQSTYIVVSWDVPKSQHKYIGDRSTLNELLDEFNVVIDVPAIDSESTTVQVRGPAEYVGDSIKRIYQRAFSMKKIELEVPVHFHKYLMGPKGLHMQQLKDVYPRTNVKFLRNDKVEIEGPIQDVMMVESELYQWTRDLAYEKVAIDGKYINRIIGRNGFNLTYLKNQYNVMVNILDEDDNKKFLTIIGKSDGVTCALNDIDGQIKKLENEDDIKVPIEQKHHGAIIGTKGKNVRELRDRYPSVVINFPDPSEHANYVQIRGPRDEVSIVKEFILEKVKEIEELSYRKDIKINRDVYDFLAEKSSLKIRKIQVDTQTKIDYYDETETLVMIGRKENVLRAEEIIGQVLEEAPTVSVAEVLVPPKFIEIFSRLPVWALNVAIDNAAEVVIKLENEYNSNLVKIKGDKELVENVRKQLENIAIYSNEFEVSSQYQMSVISSNLKKIQETMNVKTVTTNLKDSSKNIAVIVGPKEHLKSAVDKFETIIKNIDKMVEETVAIELKYHKNFVSKKGELCNRIIEECGGDLSIIFPVSSTQSEYVTVQGFRESVALAIQKLNDYVNDFKSFVEIECCIPQKHHRSIVGPKGSVIKEISARYNVNIKLPFKPNNINEDGFENDIDGMNNHINDTISIMGKEENCLRAKQALNDLIPTVREIEIPCDLHYSIIGQKGKNIRFLMEKHGVYIEVPASDAKSNLIRITGPEKNINDVITDMLQQTHEIRFNVDSKWHSKIIGRKGAIVNKIRMEHNVKIIFPRKGDAQNDTIVIVGCESNAKAAQDDIMKIMEGFKNLYVEEVNIDSNVHSRLIGAQGGHIKKIMKTYNVEIHFPRGDETNNNVVTIYGKEADVHEAAKHLEDKADEYLQEMETEMYEKTKYTNDVYVNSSLKNNGYVNGITWEHPTPNTSSVKDFPSFGNSVDSQITNNAWGVPRRH